MSTTYKDPNASALDLALLLSASYPELLPAVLSPAFLYSETLWQVVGHFCDQAELSITARAQIILAVPSEEDAQLDRIQSYSMVLNGGLVDRRSSGATIIDSLVKAAVMAAWRELALQQEEARIEANTQTNAMVTS
jgi:hypothetical protein